MNKNKLEIERLRKDNERLINNCLAYENANNWQANKIKEYEDVLRKIDTHIRSTPKPVSYIIETLKNTLPEYK